MCSTTQMAPPPSTKTGLWWTKCYGNGDSSVLGSNSLFATAASQPRSSAAIPSTAVGTVKWPSSCLELARDNSLAKWLSGHGWLGLWNAVSEKFLIRRECTGCAQAEEKISSSTEEAGSSAARKAIHSPRTPLRPGRSEPKPGLRLTSKIMCL